MYIDIPLGHRLWRVTVLKPDVEIEYIVPEARLPGLIASVSCEPGVTSFRCRPYHDTASPDVWMAAGPPSLEADARDLAA